MAKKRKAPIKTEDYKWLRLYDLMAEVCEGEWNEEELTGEQSVELLKEFRRAAADRARDRENARRSNWDRLHTKGRDGQSKSKRTEEELRSEATREAAFRESFDQAERARSSAADISATGTKFTLPGGLQSAWSKLCTLQEAETIIVRARRGSPLAASIPLPPGALWYYAIEPATEVTLFDPVLAEPGGERLFAFEGAINPKTHSSFGSDVIAFCEAHDVDSWEDLHRRFKFGDFNDWIAENRSEYSHVGSLRSRWSGDAPQEVKGYFDARRGDS